jgi:hypothetical protein
MPRTTSRDRVSEVFIFVFILPSYYLGKTGTGKSGTGHISDLPTSKLPPPPTRDWGLGIRDWGLGTCNRPPARTRRPPPDSGGELFHASAGVVIHQDELLSLRPPILTPRERRVPSSFPGRLRKNALEGWRNAGFQPAPPLVSAKAGKMPALQRA